MLDRFLAWRDLRASRTAPPRTAGPTDRVLRVLGWLRLLARRSTAENAGSALVEFSVTAPLLVSLALGVADYGTMVNQQAILEAATRTGAEYARANFNSDAPSWTNTKGMVTGFTSFSPTVTASVATVCTCADNTTVTCPGTTTCASGHGADSRVIQYVSVAATQNFTPMLAYASVAFPSQLSAVTVTRTQ